MSNTLASTLTNRLVQQANEAATRAQRELEQKALVAAAFDASMASQKIDKPVLPHLLVAHGGSTTLMFKAPDAEGVLTILDQFDLVPIEKIKEGSTSGFYPAGSKPRSYSLNAERRPAGTVKISMWPHIHHAHTMKVEAESSLTLADQPHRISICIELAGDHQYLPYPTARIVRNGDVVHRIEEAKISARKDMPFPPGLTQIRYSTTSPDQWPHMVLHSTTQQCAVLKYLGDIAHQQAKDYEALVQEYRTAHVESKRGEFYDWSEKGWRAGTPAQHAVLNSGAALMLRAIAEKFWVPYCRDRDIDPGTDPYTGRVKTSFDYHTWAKHILAEAGLLEDMALPCTVKGQVRGYVYGTQWVTVEQAKLAQANREAGIFVTV